MTNSRKLLVVSFFILGTLCLSGKESYPQEDTKLWVNAQVQYDIDRDWEIELEQELRYFEDITQLQQWITDVGVGYSITNILKTSLFYRYRVILEDDENRSEVFANFYFAPYFGNFEIDNRVRLQTKFREEDEAIYLLRYRLSLEYRITKNFIPYLSGELFYRFNYDKGDRLIQGRYKAGCEVSISSVHSLDIYFMREIEYNSNKIVNSSIFGLGYKFRF